MKIQEVYNQLNQIFTDILDLDELINLKAETTAEDVEEWDSLTHIELIVAIEKIFKIRFTAKEIQSWKNIGEMVSSIVERSK